MKCGAMCDHMSDGASWMDGRCSRCGYECQHQYDSSTGRCSICNYECSHMWMEDVIFVEKNVNIVITYRYGQMEYA